MRNLGALVLAMPILVAVYVRTLLRRGIAGRLGAGIAAGAIIGLVAVVSLPPAPSAASPASERPAPVAAEVLEAVRTGHSLTAPVVVRFAAPMDAAAVAAALRILPDSAVSLDWDAAGVTLTISPVGHWKPDTLYTVSVDVTARALSGGPLAAPVRALLLTERGGSAQITAARTTGAYARTDTAFLLRLDRPVSIDAVRVAIRTDPRITGIVSAGDAPGSFVFTPSAPLAPATRYHVWFEGLVAADGVAFASAPSLAVTTVAAPGVIRFRPRTGTRDVARGAAISVRFTEPMDRASVAAALRVIANGSSVPGKVSWAEKDTVLVFEPAADLPYAAAVSVTVDVGARSRAGVPLAKPVTGTFTVEAKPAAAPKAPTPTKPKPISTGGGGAVSGSWTGVEAYYLKLMNCTRTGGWVTSTGACSSPGGRDVAPLALSSGISSSVARPYAKLLATRGLCNHFINGNPGDRLRRAGYTSYRWAENLGCRSGDPYKAVLGSHRYFQDEKPYLGGHYVNLMNAAYDRAGIGVWVSSGRVRLVVDFYHP